MEQKLIFFGSGSYTIPIVEMLQKHGLELVVTTEQDGNFLNYLKKQNIDFISSNLKNKEHMKRIKDMKPDIAVLASYGAIVPKLIIDNCRLGILNIHPSLLPKYKGPSPIQTAIVNGEKQTGVTIIKLDEEIDHGPIVAQKEVMLTGNETTQDLTTQLFAMGMKMVDDILIEVENGKPLISIAQEQSNEKITSKITRESGLIDINNVPNPEMLNRMIRAYYPWPGVLTEYEFYGKNRKIKLLPENKIQVEGKKVMTMSEFLNGYQQAALEFLSRLGLSS